MKPRYRAELNVLLADRPFQHGSRFRLLAHVSERVPLHHLSHRRGDGDRGVVRVPVRPLDHRSSAAAPGQGPADPHRRPAIASHHQDRHADHGRADDPFRARGLVLAVGQSAQPLRVDRARGDARFWPRPLPTTLLTPQPTCYALHPQPHHHHTTTLTIPTNNNNTPNHHPHSTNLHPHII